MPAIRWSMRPWESCARAGTEAGQRSSNQRGRGLLTACVPGPVERSVGAVAARAHHRCTVRDAILDPTGLRGSADGVRSGAEERHAGVVAGRAPTVVASCPPRSSIRQGRRRDEPRAHRGGESAWRTSLRGAPTVVASCPPQAMWALVLLAALVYPTGARGLLTRSQRGGRASREHRGGRTPTVVESARRDPPPPRA
jgi:hypothetical protein